MIALTSSTAHVLTLATASGLILAACLRAAHCARTSTAGQESEALAEQEAAAEAAVAKVQHLTRADIWRSRVDRQMAPPRVSDQAAAQAYLEAAAHYHRATRRHPREPVAFTADADAMLSLAKGGHQC